MKTETEKAIAKSPGRDAAEYDQRIVIEENIPDDAADGQPVANWDNEYASRYAKIVSRGGRERIVWEQMGAQVDHVVFIRACSTTRLIDPARHRVRWINTIPGGEDRILNIESVVDVENRHVELQLRCVESPL